MEYCLQKVILPTDPKHLACQELFLRSENGILDSKKQTLTLGLGQHCDFTTYLNAYSWQKWQKYTEATDLTLHLEIEGDVKVTLVGYSEHNEILDKDILASEDFTASERKVVKLSFPQNECTVVGFEVVALSAKVILFGGYFSTEITKEKLQPVVLSLATTTFKKEDFITKNIGLLKKDLLDQTDDCAENLYIHIVDNGETLPKTIAEHKHIFLHPAHNTGGSGGFTRGMIESLHQKPRVTHVLLMDDDVLVLPESIRRTYALLRILRPEYQDCIIAGAMLYYEKLWQQHEDIGTISEDNIYAPAKPEYDLREIKNIVRNEKLMPQPRGAYSAWWYSCMPRSIMEKFGFSLPIFIRGDDTEYGIRTRAQYITMNGICVWHMGFTQKTNIALKYFGIRNSLIMSAASQVISEASALQLVKDSYRTEILRFNYEMADLVLDAFEDFLQGPDHLKEIDNAEKMRLYSARNPELVELTELNHHAQEFQLVDSPLSLIERGYLKLTANGQKFLANKIHKSSDGYTVYGKDLLPKHIVACETVVAVNPENTQGVVLKKDLEKFRELEKRYKRAMKLYKKSGQQIRDEYAKKRAEITSEDYWCKYLGIDFAE